MSETKQGYSSKPVQPTFSMTEGLAGIMMVRTYNRMRREQGEGEDAILAYFYQELLSALQAAAKDDPDEFHRAELLMQVPEQISTSVRRHGG